MKFDYNEGDLIEVAAGPDCPDGRLSVDWNLPVTLCRVWRTEREYDDDGQLQVGGVLVQPVGLKGWGVVSGPWRVQQLDRIRSATI